MELNFLSHQEEVICLTAEVLYDNNLIQTAFSSMIHQLHSNLELRMTILNRLRCQGLPDYFTTFPSIDPHTYRYLHPDSQVSDAAFRLYVDHAILSPRMVCNRL